MSWKVSVFTGFAVLGAAATGLVAAETQLPLPLKPSILLRLSTGSLPTADLDGLLIREDARLAAAHEATEQARIQVNTLKTINTVTQQYVRALDLRIREKQSGEWASSTVSP